MGSGNDAHRGEDDYIDQQGRDYLSRRDAILALEAKKNARAAVTV